MLGVNPTHDVLVSSALHALAGSDEVRAVDRDGLGTPAPIDGHLPDVTASLHGVPIVAEAITEAQLSDPSIGAKVRAFWPRTNERGERSALHLFVPRGQEERLKRVLEEVGLDPDDDNLGIHTLRFPDR